MKWVPLLLVAVLASGCFGHAGPDYPAIERAVEQAASPIATHGDANGHFQGKLHAAAVNLRELGWSNGLTDGTASDLPAGALYSAMAVGQDGYIYLASTSADPGAQGVVNALNAQDPAAAAGYGGLSIVDASDPAHVHVVSHLAALPASDVAVDPDGAYAYLANDGGSPTQALAALGATQNPQLAVPRGITVVDLNDKSKPQPVGFFSLPTDGPHALTYVRHPNGNDYLLASTADVQSDATTNSAGVLPVTQRLAVYLVSHDPVQGGPPIGLIQVAQYAYAPPTAPAITPPDASGNVPSINTPLSYPQRVEAYTVPDTSLVYLAVAYGDGGVRLVDFSNPPAPPATPTIPPAIPPAIPAGPPAAPEFQLTELGSYASFHPTAYNAIVQAAPVLSSSGATVTVVAVPFLRSSAKEVGQVTILDATSPARIQQVGNWSLQDVVPGITTQNGLFSPRGVAAWDGKAVLAHGHAGVWLLDLVHGADGKVAPKPLGFFLPSTDRTASPVPTPDIIAVHAVGDTLYALDAGTGLHILQYTGP